MTSPELPEQAVILCGTRGTRLGDVARATAGDPSPAAGAPSLAHLLGEVKRFGFRRALLLVAFEAGRVAGSARRASLDLGLDVAVVAVPDVAGTGGALHGARAALDPVFLLLDGDSWFDINWLDLAWRATRRPAAATLALRRLDDAARHATVVLDGARVAAVSAQFERPGPGLVSGGVAVVCRDPLLVHLTPSSSLERDALPRLAAEGRVAGAVYDGPFLDADGPRGSAKGASAEAQPALATRRRRPAVFLDRDGVLNRDTGYVGSPSRFQWCPEAVAGIKRFNDAGRYVFVVTNQSGVARGYYAEADVDAVHRHMQGDLRRCGAHIDAFRYCPFHVDGVDPRYARASAWRKPEPGMILDLIDAWPVDRARSVLVGDQPSDLAAAAAAGIPGVLVGPDGLDGAVADRVLAMID